jgi:hypothetical protein
MKISDIPPFGKGRLGGIFMERGYYHKISPLPSLPKRGIFGQFRNMVECLI